MSDQEMRDRLTRLETFIGINDAASGMRGDMEEIKRTQAAVFKIVRGIEKRIYIAIGGGGVVLWLLNIFVQHSSGH